LGDGDGEGDNRNNDSGVVLQDDVGIENRMGAFCSAGSSAGGTGAKNGRSAVIAVSPVLLMVMHASELVKSA